MRECQECAKLSSRQRVATLKNLKYTLICLTLSLVTTWFHMCYFIVFMSSLLFYNVEDRKEKSLNELVCPDSISNIIEIWTYIFDDLDMKCENASIGTIDLHWICAKKRAFEILDNKSKAWISVIPCPKTAYRVRKPICHFVIWFNYPFNIEGEGWSEPVNIRM